MPQIPGIMRMRTNAALKEPLLLPGVAPTPPPEPLPAATLAICLFFTLAIFGTGLLAMFGEYYDESFSDPLSLTNYGVTVPTTSGQLRSWGARQVATGVPLFAALISGSPTLAKVGLSGVVVRCALDAMNVCVEGMPASDVWYLQVPPIGSLYPAGFIVNGLLALLGALIICSKEAPPTAPMPMFTLAACVFFTCATFATGALAMFAMSLPDVVLEVANDVDLHDPLLLTDYGVVVPTTTGQFRSWGARQFVTGVPLFAALLTGSPAAAKVGLISTVVRSALDTVNTFLEGLPAAEYWYLQLPPTNSLYPAGFIVNGLLAGLGAALV